MPVEDHALNVRNDQVQDLSRKEGAPSLDVDASQLVEVYILGETTPMPTMMFGWVRSTCSHFIFVVKGLIEDVLGQRNAQEIMDGYQYVLPHYERYAGGILHYILTIHEKSTVWKIFFRLCWVSMLIPSCSVVVVFIVLSLTQPQRI